MSVSRLKDTRVGSSGKVNPQGFLLGAISITALFCMGLTSPTFAQTTTLPSVDSQGSTSPTTETAEKGVVTLKTLEAWEGSAQTLGTPGRTTATIVPNVEDTRLSTLKNIVVEGGVLATNQGVTEEMRRRGIQFKSDIAWDAVTVEGKDGTTKRVYLSEPLQSSMGLQQPTIPTGEQINAYGNIDGLINSVAELNSGKTDEEEKKGEGGVSVPATTAATQSAGGGGSSSTGNKQSPDAVKITPSTNTETKADPISVVSTTTEGCAPEIPSNYKTTGQVVKEKSQTVKDGKPQNDCNYNGNQFPIASTDASCSLDVEFEDGVGGKAWIRKEFYYVDAQQTKETISQQGCERVSETDFYAITEEKSCNLFVDIVNMKVFEQSKWVYTDGNNRKVTHQECKVPTGATEVATITATAQGCSIQDDFPAKTSTQLIQLAYTYQDSLKTASACAVRPESATYTHNVVSCGTHMADGKHYQKTKVQIDVGGIPQDRSACTIDQTTATDMTKVATTCEAMYLHSYSSSGYSIGYSRYQIERTAGQPEYVSSCEPDYSDAYKFNHAFSAPQGWENDDQNRVAKALRETTITRAGSIIPVRPATVLAWETAQPYIYQEEKTVPGEVTYAGCEKTTKTVLADVYKRPDNTLYNMEKGAGAVLGPVWACTQIATPTWAPVRQWKEVKWSCSVSYYSHGDNEGRGVGWQTKSTWDGKSYAEFEGTRLLDRDDGERITQTSEKKHTQQCDSVCELDLSQGQTNSKLGQCSEAPAINNSWTSQENW